MGYIVPGRPEQQCETLFQFLPHPHTETHDICIWHWLGCWCQGGCTLCSWPFLGHSGSFFLSPFRDFSQQLTQKCQGHYCYLQNKYRFLNLSTCLFSSDGSDPVSGLMMVRPPLLWLHWHIICSLLSPKHPPSSFPTSNTDLLDRIPHSLLYATRTALDLCVIASICLSSVARWIWLFPWACIQAAKPQGGLISLYLPGHRVCTGSQMEQKSCGFCLLSCVTASNLFFLKPETVPPSSSEQMASSYCERVRGRMSSCMGTCLASWQVGNSLI